MEIGKWKKMTFDFNNLINTMPYAVLITDCTLPDNPIIFVNPAFTLLTGYEPAEAIGRNCRFLQGAETDAATVRRMRDAVQAGMPIRCEVLNYRKNGEVFWNDIAISPIQDDQGRITRCMGIQYDSTTKHAAIAEKQEIQNIITAISNRVPGYIFQRRMDAKSQVSYPYISASLTRYMEMPEDYDWNFHKFMSFLHQDERLPFYKDLIESAAGLTRLHTEFRLIAPSGKEFWFRSDSTPRRAADGSTIWDGLAIDITAEKASAAELNYLARHDALTGLLNRSAFRHLLAGLGAPDRPEPGRVALFSIDLYQFQAVNDALGQMAGDVLLRDVGRRLVIFAEQHRGVAARLGGDEFGILFSPFPPSASAAELADRLVRAIAEPAMVNNQPVVMEACIGIALLPQEAAATREPGGDVATDLMHRAGLAQQAAKREGAGKFCLYSAQLDDRFSDHATLHVALKHALQDGQFVLHYQPMVDLASGMVIGAEALVRWVHPERGVQRPDVFIPLAEETGLIVPLGAWVLRAAMDQSQIWQRQGLLLPQLAINLSSVQLHKPGFIATVLTALEETGADPRDFEFELTESTLIAATPEIHAQLAELKAMGFSLAIDDFGTGYSTFKYIREFPVDKIKIDQIFIRNLVVNSKDAIIIRNVIALARSLKIMVMAEGIETALQRQFLRDEGCKLGQGYFFSQPLEVSAMTALLQDGVSLPQADAASKGLEPVTEL